MTKSVLVGLINYFACFHSLLTTGTSQAQMNCLAPSFGQHYISDCRATYKLAKWFLKYAQLVTYRHTISTELTQYRVYLVIMRGNDEFSLTITTLISKSGLAGVVSPVASSQLTPGRTSVRVL